MSKIERFEDIKAWKKSKELAKKIYAITSKGDFNLDYGLKNQIQRAAISIMSNIAEGFERDGNREFYQYLSQAKASSAEVQSQLHLAREIGYIDTQTFESLYSHAEETKNLISGFLNYLKKSNRKGLKYEKMKQGTRNKEQGTVSDGRK